MLEKIFSLFEQAKRAKRESGASITWQGFNYLKTISTGRHIGPSDYFDFRLFSKNDYSAENPSSNIVGWRSSSAFCKALNRPDWSILADDKVCMYGMLRDAGLSIPKTQALYHPRGRSFRGAISLNSALSIETFLRDEARYPIFCKPTLGCGGSGAQAFQRYEPSTDSVIDFEGERTSVSNLAHSVVAMAGSRQEWGYLFQEKLEQHDELRRIAGNGISSLRVLVLSGRDGIEISRVVWKVIAGNAISDNFHFGKSGNLLAGIDPETGQVYRAVQGIGLSMKHLKSHPNTGETILGFVIPRWEEVRQVCLLAARSVPMLQWQHWDIALTDRGPVILELNCEGGVNALQVGCGSGLLDSNFRSFLAKNHL